MKKKTLKKRIFTLLLMLTVFCTSFAIPSFADVSDDLLPVYISDLKWENAKVGWGNPMKDTGLEDLPLELRIDNQGNTQVYDKGLCLHAESEVTYNIKDMQVSKFESYIGINFTKERGTSVFFVYVDGDLQYQSPTMRETTPQEFVEIDIPEDAEQITLVTTGAGDGITDDHCIWADAKLYMDPAAAGILRNVSFTLSPSILSVAEQASSKVSGMNMIYQPIELTSENSSITYRSENTSIADIDLNGVITAISPGMTTITCKVIYGGVAKEAKALITVGGGDSDNVWVVASPDSSIKAAFQLNENGEITYTAIKDASTVIQDSPTGLVTNLGDFTEGLTFKGAKYETIYDSYDLLGAKKTHIDTEASELVLTFEKDSINYTITVRAYDDGIAFRYGIDNPNGSSDLRITAEETGIQIPQDSNVFVSTYNPYHENLHQKTLSSSMGDNYVMPFLYETPDQVFALISEADLSPSYCGAMIKGSADGMAKICFPPEQNTAVRTTTDFNSPWRFIVIGDLKDIVENTMAENLSPELDSNLFPDGNTDWITPGVTAWTWLTGAGTSNPDVYKTYIDMAVEMGWQYILMDEGWQPRSSQPGRRYDGLYDWVEDLADYADERGIGLIGWVHKDDLNTPAKREQFYDWAEAGIKGVKADFFDSQDQTTMQLYDDLSQLYGELGMIVNYHGANKSTGERRKYPHILTKEGVYGAEQGGNPKARPNIMLAYTRNAVGAMDYTPMISYKVAGRYYTISHMAAMAIVYESGLQCLADGPETYNASPVKSLLKSLPVTWDDTVFIDGYPDDYVNIARKTGEEWYLGIMCYTARDAEFTLDFLDEDTTYYAYIYQDGASMEDIDVFEKTVQKGDTLSIPIAETGGASVRFTKEPLTEPSEEHITLNQKELLLEQNESQKLIASLDLSNVDFNQITWKSSDKNIAIVSETGNVTGVNPGKTTIAATTGVGGRIQAVCTVTVTSPKYTLTDSWEIIRNDITNWKISDEQTLTVNTQRGDIYGTGNNDTKNIFITDAKDNNFEISVELNFIPKGNHESAGLVIYVDDDNFTAALKRYHSSYQGHTFMGVNEANGNPSEHAVPDPDKDGTAYLKMVKSGAEIICYYSLDNNTWNTIRSYTNTNLNNAENLKIGLYTGSGGSGSGIVPATYRNLTYTSSGLTKVIDFAISTEMPEPTDKTTLQFYIDKATVAMDSDEYKNAIESVKESFNRVYQEALDMLENETANQEEIDDKAYELMFELHKLGLLKGDTDELRVLVDEYNLLNLDEYEDGETKENFKELLQKAKDALTNSDLTQKEIDVIRDNLIDARENLRPLPGKANKDRLNHAIVTATYVESILDRYVERGQSEFKESLQNARTVSADPNASQDAVDVAWLSLVDTMGDLRLKADKSVLEDLLFSLEDFIRSFDESNYEKASAQLFLSALANAQSILNDPILSEDDQELVNQAVILLQNAYNQLKNKPGESESQTKDTDNETDPDTKDNETKDRGTKSTSGNKNNQSGKSGKSSAKTGDSTTIVTWLILLISLTSLSILYLRKRSR